MIRALILLALSLQQPAPQQPIKDWKYQQRTHNPKTGKEEITAELHGAEAVPISIVPKKEILEVRGIRGRYFTDPRPGQKTEEIRIEADRARMDNGAGTLKLDDQVRVENLVDGSILRTSSALVRFTPRFVCPAPACEVRVDKEGKCPVHAVDLKRVTSTSVETDQEFVLLKPASSLTGRGLKADDAIKLLHVENDGFIELAGKPSDLDRQKAKPGPPLQALYTQLYSKGPLTVQDTPAPSVSTEVRGSGGIRVDRIDALGTTTALADRMIVEVVRRIDPVTQKTVVEPRSLEASGGVSLSTVVFADGSEIVAKGDRLTWDHHFLEDYTEDVLRLTSAGKVVTSFGTSTVQAKRLTIERLEGYALFEEGVAARLTPSKEPAAQPIDLTCGKLFARFTPSGVKPAGLAEIEALETVVLKGLMDTQRPGDTSPPGVARADRFLWNAMEERGLLEGRPFVRIVQGDNTILAPKIVLESPDLFVLKGPKRIRLTQMQEGKAESYSVTAEGDIVLDRKSGRIRLRDACVIQAPGMRLAADRMNVVLSADGKGVESLFASGNVQVQRPLEGLRLFGEWLRFKPSTEEFSLIGNPYAVAETGRSIAYQEKLMVYLRVNPVTGQKVQYMESVGGRDGLRILIDEKLKNGKANGTPK